ncbi:hypothetical protein LX36DRAFT_364936 [Colletotrichum falcatum]|nr:hypothetical protein LX36DRAFT_364936 [Colletotrichum falcatum]
MLLTTSRNAPASTKAKRQHRRMGGMILQYLQDHPGRSHHPVDTLVFLENWPINHVVAHQDRRVCLQFAWVMHILAHFLLGCFASSSSRRRRRRRHRWLLITVSVHGIDNNNPTSILPPACLCFALLRMNPAFTEPIPIRLPLQMRSASPLANSIPPDPIDHTTFAGSFGFSSAACNPRIKPRPRPKPHVQGPPPVVRRHVALHPQFVSFFIRCQCFLFFLV